MQPQPETRTDDHRAPMKTVVPLGDTESGADVNAPGRRLGRIFEDADGATAGCPAIAAGAGRTALTYAALADLVRTLTARLRGRGIAAGDVVTVQATNSVEFVVSLLAASHTGATVAPLDPALPAADTRARIEMCGAHVTLTDIRSGAPAGAAYGMTETTHQASTVRPNDDDAIRFGTVGVPGVLSARIVDAQGRTCAPGTVGEICLSGPTVVRGYLNDPTGTADSFTDGWLHTGDLGSIGVDGALTIQGRIKELINRGGEKISPERVEDVLTSHPGVTQAVVFGLADALYGERVAAAVVTRDGSRPDLAAYCHGRLAEFEIPERVTFTAELPLTAKGSVDGPR